MKIYNFGSLNLDHVYNVNRFVMPGETIASRNYTLCCGGKGLNQSIAAARAGALVYHVGVCGSGGSILRSSLQESGVQTDLLSESTVPQGHAIIQVSSSGENCIILYPGSNYELTKNSVDSIFNSIKAPGYLMIQNEISEVPYIIHEGAKRGFKVVLNASPFEKNLLDIEFNDVTWLIINEIEGFQISGHNEPEQILSFLNDNYPNLGVVLTLGSSGSICTYKNERIQHDIYQVSVVDTTAAGDTFTGYFVAALANNRTLSEAVDEASAASALSVSALGAAPSIPSMSQVKSLMDTVCVKRDCKATT